MTTPVALCDVAHAASCAAHRESRLLMQHPEFGCPRRRSWLTTPPRVPPAPVGVVGPPARCATCCEIKKGLVEGAGVRRRPQGGPAAAVRLQSECRGAALHPPGCLAALRSGVFSTRSPPSKLGNFRRQFPACVMFCMQNRVLPVERASFPTCMPIFTARIADPRPGRAPDPSRLFYEAEASTALQ